ncbi:GNAT family N-acetyltransferase [Erysipelothrix rhusiopathiae]|uniref:GNAT family N-acetyltransferase n=1 Tax=Erysipelothrix TaxID=1647 RepID=UPI001378E1FE|nr:GNAT family N-acetyltransferase [Erysipelothrix sp. strain 2 (EsS2-7-Brazil)]MBK2403295.1 N-acetyltransferase [Erysipelothrix sp. strain 2 (EsS2-7-Brazil)]NBA00737.1 GNAT family N-acetyltransferase [Erysipelothrix rhusiopathiae]
MKKVCIDDLTDALFKDAFMAYFHEFGYEISNHHEFFEAMNREENNEVLAYEEAGQIIAFIMYRYDHLSHWFFTEHVMFVRELWVKPSHRTHGLASKLLMEVESEAQTNQVFKLILTTDSAQHLYLKNGYILDRSYRAKNNHPVYIKSLTID